MNDKPHFLKTPLFNLLIGALLGLAIGAGIAAHEMTVRQQKIVLDLDTAWHLKYGVAVGAQQSCVDQMAQYAERQKREADLRDSFYTLLYEPTSIPATQQPSPLELANVIRPGLGTLLARLQPPAASVPGTQLRWILNGYVQAVTAPQGARAVYTRVPPNEVQ